MRAHLWTKFWHLRVCPTKNIFEFSQKINKYLLQISKQTNTYKDSLGLLSFLCEIELNQLLASSLDNLATVMALDEHYQLQLPHQLRGVHSPKAKT